jgi:hypothetical protein
MPLEAPVTIARGRMEAFMSNSMKSGVVTVCSRKRAAAAGDLWLCYSGVFERSSNEVSPIDIANFSSARTLTSGIFDHCDASWQYAEGYSCVGLI